MTDRTAARLMDLYQRGTITRLEFASFALDWVDPTDPTPVLDGLPEDVLDDILRASRLHLSGEGIRIDPGGGDPATREQVLAVKTWIERRRGQQD